MKTILCFIFAAMLVTTATAQTEKAAIAQKGNHASFEGQLVCLGCDLKKAEGARAACTAYGHKHALKMKDGGYISFLENDFSKDLINGEKYHNDSITVTGVFHDKANVLDVETFTVNGEKKGWCNHCKAMDGCPFMGKGKM